MKRFFAFLVCALLLCNLLPTTALAAEEVTASTMRLVKCDGEVTVKKASGKKVSFKENMRLYNNYQVITERKSYAYISLDKDKAIKLDASTKITISRHGRKLEIMVEKGKLLFDVSKPLENDESLNIRTSTMITGVRGTIGWVATSGTDQSQLCLLEGSTLVTTWDNNYGNIQTTLVESGQALSAFTADDGQSTETELTDLTEKDTPGFVRDAIADDPELKQRVEDNTDLDTDELANSAQETLQQEEQAAEDQAEQIQQELDQSVTENIDSLFDDSSDEEDTPPSPIY